MFFALRCSWPSMTTMRYRSKGAFMTAHDRETTSRKETPRNTFQSSPTSKASARNRLVCSHTHTRIWLLMVAISAKKP